ncbi:MAG: ATP-dependent helicase mitochondrial [Subtercola sp.]|nr:ATP-dependent helicase mitochondrial [Subtercola sp.]
MVNVGFERESQGIVQFLPPTTRCSAPDPSLLGHHPRGRRQLRTSSALAGLSTRSFPFLLQRIDRESKAARETGGYFKAIVLLPATLLVQLSYVLLRALRRWVPLVSPVHPRLTQDPRTHASTQFKTAQSAILLSPDAAARGLDSPNREQSIHRLARTGLADRKGRGRLFVVDPELRAAQKLFAWSFHPAQH